MSKCTFSFDRDWIEAKKKQFKKNPIRILEKYIIEFEGANLVSSTYNGFAAEIEEDLKQKFLDGIEECIRESLDEDQVWNVATVFDEKGENLTPEKEYSEKRDIRNTVKEKPQEADTEEAEIKETVTEEVKTEEKETKKPETEAPAEQTKVREMFAENPKDPQEIQWYSEEIIKHVEELDKTIPMLKSMHAEECIWGQNLLVSIDRGFGYTSFLMKIAETYQKHGLGEAGKDCVKEMEIDAKKGMEAWKEVLDRVKGMARENEKKRTRLILSLDISACQNKLETPEVREYLRKIAEATTNFICVFRVPFMEGQVIRQLEESLLDVMPIKALAIAPTSLEDMVSYMTRELYLLNCIVEDDCKEVMEQWILQEKKEAGFYGYKTLNKMVKQLIYKKALLNCEEGLVSKTIKPEDVKAMLTEENSCDDPEVLLNRLIGIASIKQRIQEIIIQIKTQKEFADKGSELERPSIHMMFTGNPGTGKTTVARIVAKMMKQEGILRKGLFFEIGGRDLCGQYVGETAPKTSAYCRDAYGSVLFIDEAYSLYTREYRGFDYGKEAINTLIAEMENHRDDFCVILAGYKEDMDILMEANDGLQSRIPHVIHFPNYSREELEQIFFLMLDGKIAYEEGLKDAVRDFFASIPDEVMNDKTFSNARLVRNLFERAWGKAAYRRSLSKEEELTIRKEDLRVASEEQEFKNMLDQKPRNRIGFI